MNITLEVILAKLPIGKLKKTIEVYIHPLLQKLPDKRLWAVAMQMVLGILGRKTPVITEMAGSNSKREGST
jgi:hypothetical protein